MASNGQLPDSELVPIAGYPGARLRPGAAASWALVRAEVQRRFGWTPAVTSDADAYRSLAIQTSVFKARYQTTVTSYGRSSTGVALYDRRVWNGVAYWRKAGQAAAAVPGTSNHGWGSTVDVAFLGGFDGQRYAQWAAVAGATWSNAEGQSVDEAWHWKFMGDLEHASNPVGSTGTVPTIPTVTVPTDLPEADMPLNQADLDAIRAIVAAAPSQPAQEAFDRIIASEIDGRLRVRDGSKVPAGDAGVLVSQAGKEELDRMIANRMDERFVRIFAALADIAADDGKGVTALNDDDLTRIATAVQDEQDRRERARLAPQ